MRGKVMLLLAVWVGIVLGSCADTPAEEKKNDQFHASSNQTGGMKPSSGLGGFTATGGGWGPGNSGFKPSESGKRFKGF